jgi:hypothetical protein
VVVVSISGGTWVHDNVVEYTATLLGEGATDDVILALIGNMKTGDKLEFPMLHPSMFLDGDCHAVYGMNPSCTVTRPFWDNWF